jgi:rubredoxin
MIKPCTLKPCVYQPNDDEWYCPRCGKKENFIVDTDYADSCEGGEENEGCPLVHEKDYVVCRDCGYDTNGKAFVNRLTKNKNLEKCLCCKGKGFVTREQNESYKLLVQKKEN